jgi:hypothetical protein
MNKEELFRKRAIIVDALHSSYKEGMTNNENYWAASKLLGITLNVFIIIYMN